MISSYKGLLGQTPLCGRISKLFPAEKDIDCLHATVVEQEWTVSTKINCLGYHWALYVIRTGSVVVPVCVIVARIVTLQSVWLESMNDLSSRYESSF